MVTEDIVERIEEDEVNLTFNNAGKFKGGIEPPVIYREQMEAMLMKRVNPLNYKFFEIKSFPDELEEIAQHNRSEIHIFRTQNEVDNYMQSDQKDQGVRTRARKFVQPLPEPEYIILTPKNTYFCPSD